MRTVFFFLNKRLRTTYCTKKTVIVNATRKVRSNSLKNLVVTLELLLEGVRTTCPKRDCCKPESFCWGLEGGIESKLSHKKNLLESKSIWERET